MKNLIITIVIVIGMFQNRALSFGVSNDFFKTTYQTASGFNNRTLKLELI